MPMLPITNFERGGLNLDSDPFSLTNEEWSGGKNIRFDNRSVSKITGEATLKATEHSPNEFIYWQQPGAMPDRYIYKDSTGILRSLVASSTDTVDNPLSTAISTTTRADMSLFNGGATLLVNDEVSTPQFVHSPDVTGATSTSQMLSVFPGWLVGNTYSAITAKVVRPFRNTIVAGNLTYTNSSGTIFGPSTIRVSNLAARGEMPTWDPQETGATTADEFDLASNSPIIDMVPFQNSLAIYSSDSISLMTLTGNSSIPVAITPGAQGRGLLSKDCAIEFYGRHFVVGNEDIYLYGGGAQIRSLADARVRDYFFGSDGLNRDQVDLTTVVHNRLQSEIWIGYARGNSTTINEVLIYNYDHDTWSRRDADNATGMAFGPVIVNNSFDNTQNKVIFSNATDNELIVTDTGNSFRGSDIEAFVERRGLDIAPNNTNVSKWTDEVYYIATGSGELEIKTKPTEAPGRTIDFDSRSDRDLKTNTFSLSSSMGDYKTDPRANGRYYNTRIRSNDSEHTWSLIRYNISFTADDDR